MRVEEVLFRHAARRPNHTALVCGSLRLSYSELEKAIRAKSGSCASRERVPIQWPRTA
jgi:non-ribosomal peptide synthetase component E (peptide arylation enzyme)